MLRAFFGGRTAVFANHTGTSRQMYPEADADGPGRVPAAPPEKDPQRRIDCAPRRESAPPDPQTSRGRGTPDRASETAGHEPAHG